MAEDNKRRVLIPWLSVFLILAGVGILMYPALADYKNRLVQENAIQAYTTSEKKLADSAVEEQLRKARRYNDNLNGVIVHEPFDPDQGYVLGKEYSSLLNPGKDGVMGMIEIPSIDVRLPIYHGSNEDVLARGVGHIEGTSLPIGGPRTHAILTGHRGLPSATLFTNLDKLHPGDQFYITVLGKTLAYKVYETQVIEPEELKSADFQADRDLVTLVTCTPYGVNTHRLLVHAERTAYDPRVKNNAVKNIFVMFNIRVVMFSVAIGVLCGVVVIYVVRSYRHKRCLTQRAKHRR